LDGYAKEVEVKMQRLFATLSEKDRRRYAGIEAAKLGHGGIEYISGLFQIDPKTIRHGLMELEPTDDPAAMRVRKKGGGRKAAREQQPELENNFTALAVAAPQQVGSVHLTLVLARRGDDVSGSGSCRHACNVADRCAYVKHI
jgi:hypothetical protein